MLVSLDNLHSPMTSHSEMKSLLTGGFSLGNFLFWESGQALYNDSIPLNGIPGILTAGTSVKEKIFTCSFVLLS